MAIMELAGEAVRFVRTNQAYRDFMKRYFWPSLSTAPAATPSDVPPYVEAFFNRYAQICRDNRGDQLFVDEVLPDGSTVRFLMRYIKTNPATGTTALVIAVLAIA